MPLFRTLTPRHRWFLTGLIVLSATAAVWTLDVVQRRKVRRTVIDEIRNAGGEVLLRSSLYDRLRAHWSDEFSIDVTIVSLNGDSIDGEWLRRLNNLHGLAIDILHIGDCPLSGPDIAPLIEQHPITFLSVRGISNSDAIARALGTSRSLQGASFWDCDLTDSGLRLLPLETLERVDVPGTAVTSTGLKELRSCRKLEEIAIGGRQFDDSVAELLCGTLTIYSLSLCGKDVTDDHLSRIRGMSLRSVVLRDTSATPLGVQALRGSLPNCEVRVYSTKQENRSKPPG